MLHSPEHFVLAEIAKRAYRNAVDDRLLDRLVLAEIAKRAYRNAP